MKGLLSVAAGALILWAVLAVAARMMPQDAEQSSPDSSSEQSVKDSAESRPDVEEVVDNDPIVALLHQANYLLSNRGGDLNRQVKLRTGGKTILLGLYQRGAEVQVSYRDPKSGEAERYHLRFARQQIVEVRKGGAHQVMEPGDHRSIAGTDLQVEDLAMPWLQWKDRDIIGEEKKRGQNCVQVLLRNPTSRGQFAQVQIWVQKKNEVLSSCVGYDREGRALKRILVTDVIKTERGFQPRRVRIDRVNPVSNRIENITYLEFENGTRVLEGEGENRGVW